MIELLRQRRSIRQFENTPVEPDKRNQLTEALLRSPSSRNFDPWEFIVVDDRQLLDKLSQSKQHGSAFLKGAPLGIVICADENKSDVWVEDCSIASILVQLTAQSLGLGSCWIQIRKRMHDETVTSEDYIRTLLDIPEGIRVESIIAVGYPAEHLPGVPAENLKTDRIRANGWR